jgi:5-methylcytosine-specific restriction endonuclease McrA
VVTPDTEAAWVERACAVSSRVLERQVSAALVGELPSPHVGEVPKGPERVRLVFDASSADAEVVRDALAWLRASTGVKREDVDDGVLLAALCRRAVEAAAEQEEAASTERYRVVVEHCPECRTTTGAEADLEDTVATEATCDAVVVEMRDGPTRGHQGHTVPPAKRRAALHRDRHRCRAPGCSHRMYVDVHHVRSRSCGGGHEEKNLCTLCTVHHRLVHDGKMGVEVHGDDLVFRLPDGRTVRVPLDPRDSGLRGSWAGLGKAPAPRTTGTGLVVARSP